MGSGIEQEIVKLNHDITGAMALDQFMFFVMLILMLIMSVNLVRISRSLSSLVALRRKEHRDK